LSKLLIRLRDYRHRVAHQLRWQTGYVVSGWSGRALWIGFRCARCGEVTGAHISDRYGEIDPAAGPPTVWQR